MKLVILAGVFGTRISKVTAVAPEIYGDCSWKIESYLGIIF